METKVKKTKALTKEDVWKGFDELRQIIKESDARWEKSKQESRAEFDKEMKESRAEWKKIMKELSAQIGGVGNSNGDFAHDFFYNAFLYGNRNLFGETFDDVLKGNEVTINKGFEDEYDILLLNCRAVCIIEVKYKADSGDLLKKVLRKVETFRVNFPQHSNKTIYLAVAGMSFNKRTEKAFSENGIILIKQVGNTMVISNEHLKTF